MKEKIFNFYLLFILVLSNFKSKKPIFFFLTSLSEKIKTLDYHSSKIKEKNFSKVHDSIFGLIGV
ncbi:hypothetical protein LEP1GSC036_1493 [Leptospira weilii str. 2006001853]|uniref:Uncharacterized protein n=2 Tax=Leptospira weilii TaxID=28184 RepID=A0A828Z9N4_9LEPT|nr:hypothetical protein LEP1GSC036_1493 [Leptospira weilii str. 2006001853]EMN46069.1 hypothetical protein LEP1GSC086_2242 [Leptospira weilii str. LNT 1234]EMN91707.1 hypothetical protein LEP1GSC108_1777 [Leptospira weilii str. UI 13098]OMI16824.1 hypothetical protein BUQ74_13315 [Leptospira weilii serovar Heyan]QDK21476.1 hypothetical protein FHG67_00930 [Leptospira weilii]